MRRFTPTLVVAGLATLLATSMPARAQSVNIVVPNSSSAVEGNLNNSYPFNLFPVIVPSMRFQQVFNASQMGTRKLLIYDLEFRPDGEQGTQFLSFIDDIQVNLSTTSAAVDALSTTFASNVGADDTIVYPRQNMTLSSNFNGLGPMNFDIRVRLNTPFAYNPANGNLLLDVRTYACTSDTTVMDAVRTAGDSVSRIYALNVNAATGTADTLGLITRFRAVRVSTLSGTINLENADETGVPITFIFRPVGEPTFFSRTVVLTAGGTFQIDNIPSDNYEIAVKGSKWLQKAVARNLTGGDYATFNYTLLGGDANNDNVVDISDLLLLISSYNQVSPSPSYLYATDFNNDGQDDILDLLILIGNYNTLGDP